MNNFSNIVACILAIGGIVAVIVCYARALTEVKCGRLIVYRNWGDFFKASAWIVLLPFGLRNMLYGICLYDSVLVTVDNKLNVWTSE